MATIKLAVLALLAPALRMPIAAGITEHEHNGKGVPINAAVTTELSFPSILLIHLSGTSRRMIPANNKPSNKKGADSVNNAIKLVKISFIVSPARCFLMYR